MKPIPAAMRQKLLQRFKSAGTGTEPHIRLIATQTSMNTLMSEPIHEDVDAALGDVTVRQTYGDDDIALAYAICIHEGVASVYERRLPALMDATWEFVFELGEAEDVAIEYDGVWEIDASYQWYILRTQQFPYIFFVQDGDLFVQYWRDTTTRIQLASNVSNISACRGWQNTLDGELDQGLIIGYIKSGEVYYRSLCQQQGGAYSWETERKISTLSTGNTTLAVFRTNDYRVGFLTQNGDDMKMTLTHRNYAGGSVRPETMHAASRANFEYIALRRKYGYERNETMTAGCSNPFFVLDTVPASAEIAVASTAKINREDTYYCYGVKLIFDKDFTGTIDAAFIGGISASYTQGSTTVAASVGSVTMDVNERSLSIFFSADIKRVYPITVTTPSTRKLKYERVQSMRWFFPSFTANFAGEVINKYGYEPETLTATATASFEYEAANKVYGYESETMTAASAATVALQPSSVLPI